ncbi:ABC transporter ATP-binding protein [Saccharomonospora xinjiangensis]|nr:Daunorubicin/doxorubicin resistance ATP-binding protein DrrA [Saccharomonospora xinjiangensis]
MVSRRLETALILSVFSGSVAVVSDDKRPQETEGDALVLAEGLVKRFGDFEAVRGIDLDVRRGEAFGFLGPNGAGKSSTMRMIASTSPRSGGRLSVLGMDPGREGPRIRARLGVVPQQDNLDQELTVRQNLQVYGRYFGLSRASARAKADELLDFAQLVDKADAEVESLSGGMKRRLTIARSLVNEPELLLLDEPTTGLDPQARHLLWDKLFRLKSQGVTLLVTTHYMDEAEQLCDRLVVMDGGRIVAEGSPADLISRYSTREVLELRMPQAEHEQAVAVVSDLGERTEVLPDRILVYTDSGEAALEKSHARGVRPVSSLVRRSTLEDVFLRLTGRSLIE